MASAKDIARIVYGVRAGQRDAEIKRRNEINNMISEESKAFEPKVRKSIDSASALGKLEATFCGGTRDRETAIGICKSISDTLSGDGYVTGFSVDECINDISRMFEFHITADWQTAYENYTFSNKLEPI